VPAPAEVDVIVVGAGAAGLAAASEAARLGRRVVAIEKNPRAGGMTSWSVGTVTATNTPHQLRAGIRDTPDEHFEDLALHAGPLVPRDNLALRRILVDNSNEMFAWLQELGIVFIGPIPDPPHRYPRLHSVVPSAEAFAYHLTRHCRRLGVEIRLNTRVARLLHEDGKVTGAEAQAADGTSRQYRARGAVVLASGDYSAAPDIKARYATEVLASALPVTPTSTGDGYRIAFDVGATMLNGDIIRGPIMRFVPAPRGNFIQRLPPMTTLARMMVWAMDHLPQRVLRPFLMTFVTSVLGPSGDLFKQGAVLVNRLGQRFTDELATPQRDLVTQPDGTAHIIFDASLAKRFSARPHFISTAPGLSRSFLSWPHRASSDGGIGYAYLPDYRRTRPDIYHEAASIDALAAAIGIAAVTLRQCIDEYNESARGARPAIVSPPFYALGPVKSYVPFTEGGLRVTERLEVVRNDGAPIRGLYAAGAVGQGGLLLEGHGHHLAWAFVSGRIAGRNAAFDVPRGKPLTDEIGEIAL
jgi:succinate dehydrogenase/fumarate reductase flavoprotein subunit